MEMALAKALDIGCERFASWRWKTITLTIASLLRVREALVQTIGVCRHKSDLGLSDTTLANTLIVTVNCELFWSRTLALHRCFSPLGNFSSWLTGCECHEEERLAKKPIACDWQGVRGPELAPRLRSLHSELSRLREDGQRVGGVSGSNIAILVNVMVATLLRRFDWVGDIQFRVWQVRQ